MLLLAVCWIIWCGVINTISISYGAIALFLTYLISHYFNVFSPSLKLISYLSWLMKEVVYSTFAVVKLCWSKNVPLDSRFALIKTNLDEFGKVIYGHSITLTPGTVVIAIEEDALLVHALTFSSIEDLIKGVMEQKTKKLIA